MQDCPCGSGLAYEACCEPIIKKQTKAETAEALMRSRFTAYAVQAIDHLRDSLQASDRQAFDAESAREWAKSAEWNKLEVLATEAGGVDDDHGIVEFKAHYTVDEQALEHHERAQFTREKGEWVFVEGRVIGRDPYRREQPKIGRNDPCNCGSGKKFKKCCGR